MSSWASALSALYLYWLSFRVRCGWPNFHLLFCLWLAFTLPSSKAVAGVGSHTLLEAETRKVGGRP